MVVAVEFLAGELRTGRRLTQLPVSAGSWSTVLNEPGEITVTIPLGDQSVSRRAEILAQLEPTRCFLAVQVGDAIVEAGPIWSHDFDGDSGQLTVKALGLGSLWDHRLVVKVLTSGQTYQGTSLSWSGLSLGTIAKRLVSTAMSHTGGSLPLILPPDETGTHERTYPGYELASLGQRLEELVNVEGGPDIAFDPRLTTDRLGVEWVMRTGTAADPLLHQGGGQAWVWDTAAPRWPGGQVSVTVDATQRVNRAFAMGDGFETSLLLATAQDASQWSRGYPLLEATSTHSTVTRQATLAGHARAMIDQGSAPWTTWKLRATTGSVVVGDGNVVRAGDWCAIHIPAGHMYLREGVYRSRLGRMTGDAEGRFVELTLLPTKEHR